MAAASSSTDSSSAMSVGSVFDLSAKLGGNPVAFLDALAAAVTAASKEKNVVISPVSILGPLSYLLPATKTSTRVSMAAALLGEGVSLEDEAALAAAQAMSEAGTLLSEAIAESSGGSAEFAMASRVVLKNGLTLSSEMQKVLLDDLAEVNPSDRKASVKNVNDWVSEKTGGKITELVTPEDFGPLFRLAVISAVYFKGKFEIPFDKTKTAKDFPFFASRSDASKGLAASPLCTCSMMNSSGMKYPYCKTAQFTCVRLDYAKDKLALILALPNSDGTPSMKQEQLFGLKFKETKMNLSVPRFKFEYDVLLNEILSELGMAELFSDKCDLSGLLSSDEDLHVSAVKHRAMVEVNEEGTTASAATAAIVKTRGRPKTMTIRFNSKFDFFIVDLSQSLVLFSGTVVKPSE